MELKGKKINFLGDSITEGVGTSGYPYRYFDLIAGRCGAVCRGYGISGTRIAIQRTPSDPPSFDLYFSSRVDGMDADADAVVVFGGTNDFGHGDAPFGTMDDRTPETFMGGLHDLCTRLINRYPGKLIVLCTPLHRLGEESKWGEHKDAAAGSLLDYVRGVRQVAEYYGIPVLDLFAISGIQPAVELQRELFMPDGLHPNDAGHELLANLMIRFLERC